jgi:hypothetical protein
MASLAVGVLVVMACGASRAETEITDKFDAASVPEGYCGEGALYASPEAGQALGDFMLDSPRLDYRMKIDKPGTYYVWVRGTGRYYYSNMIQIGMDGAQARSFETGWQNLKYRWRSTAKDKPFEVKEPGVHWLSQSVGVGPAETAARKR